MLPGLFNDEKRVASLIVGTVDGEKEKKVDESIDDIGIQTASEDILSAIKNNSVSELKEALKTFFELCSEKMEQKEEIGEELEPSEIEE
jgi:hypothetical protein